MKEVCTLITMEEIQKCTFIAINERHINDISPIAFINCNNFSTEILIHEITVDTEIMKHGIAVSTVSNGIACYFPIRSYALAIKKEFILEDRILNIIVDI